MTRDIYSRADRTVGHMPCRRTASGAPRAGVPSPVHGIADLEHTSAATPQFTIFAKVDMTACVHLRRLLDGTAKPPTYNDMFVKAAALALTTVPTLNARYERHRIVAQEHVDIGIVIATEGRQTFGSVQDAEALTLAEVSCETQRLSQAVWDGQRAEPVSQRPPAFTVSNLGMYGVTKFSGYVVPHQAAILSIGAIEQRPVVSATSQVEVRPLAELGLTCDHRVVSAADAAFFLECLRELLTDGIDQLHAA
jgi:pyruvate dehydrogenase E2 component (dihydrolipoamide acetyltransferase)